MTDLSSQSGDRESKVFLQEAINRQVAACSNRASLPPLDSVSWSSAFSIAQGFGEPSRELRGHDLNPTKVKVEASEGRRPKTEMEGRGFPAESSGDHLNEGILVLKSVSNMAEEQPDTTMEPVPSMYCLSDGNILVPMFCPELVAEHAGKHLESKMNDSKGYTLQQSDISQSSLMAHFQHQQQQHHEYLSSWAESSSHVGSSYDTYGSEYASEADYQAIQPHHFQQQQQQQRQQQQQQQQQQQPHQSHLHQHPEVTSNPPKKKRRRIITTDQRRAANIRERRRMSHLNEAFDGLRKRVPTFAYEKKLSRIETLKLAVTYIKFMSGLLETLDSSGDSRRSGMGFHGDQKLVQSVHSGPLFHSSLPNLSARHHVHLSISTNCSSLATDDDESLDEEEGGDVVGDLQGKRCMEMPIKGCKDLEFKK